MKIVFLNDYGYVQGGASKVAVHSCLGLAEAGYDVTFIFAVGPADSSLLHPNVHLVDLKKFDLLSNPSKGSAALVGIWNADVKRQIDGLLAQFDSKDTVVHVHSWVKGLSISGVYACVTRGFSTVLTLHDYFSVCPNGGFYNYQDEVACDLRPLSLQCLASNCDSRGYSHKLWRSLRQAVTQRAAIPRDISNFVYVSDFSLNILRPYLPSRAKFWYIPNPIEVEKLEPADPVKAAVFTFVGRLVPEKGVELFAKAARQADVQCRFVGDGDLRSRLGEIVPRAEFIGWVNKEEVVRQVKDSRAVVFPSVLYETQGMASTEAAALGIPCIVSDACAARDSVVDNFTGRWFKSGDVDSLADTMRAFAEDPELARRLGMNAYKKYWAAPSTIETHVTRLVACYESALELRHAG